MATRSTIALEFNDGTVKQIYCHWDGYLDNNGVILHECWSDPNKLCELIDEGDMSTLGHTLDGCQFYGRDRGEEDTQAQSYINYDQYVDDGMREDYNYILRIVGGVPIWYVAQYDNVFVKLESALLDTTS